MSAERQTLPASSLHDRVAALQQEHATRWRTTPAALPRLGAETRWWRQLSNERAATRLIDALAAELVALPNAIGARRAWQDAVRQRLQRFGEVRLGWPAGYQRLLLGSDFFDASCAFARQARGSGAGLRLPDLWQALRNVWIGNSLQMVLGLPVVLNPGLFAYSMLYPLTDNLLDAADVTPRAKHAFNQRFGRRLAGHPILPADPHEAAVFGMIERVETEFPRARYDDVHASLWAIHAAQARSLRQQAPAELTGREILSLSCEKGGSSVLADLYLVAGSATEEEERFAFGYGVFLQLLDDLQDVSHDLAAGHETLFTRAARCGVLDEPATRLARFMYDVLEAWPRPAHAQASDCRDLIRRNCVSLLVGAVADQPQRFSRGFRRAVFGQWPFSWRALRRLRRRAEQRFGKAAKALERATGSDSLLEWALEVD